MITLEKMQKQDKKKVKKLYKLAFPKSERKPLRWIKDTEKKGRGERLCIKDGDKFCGLAFVLSYRDMILLDYFAVLPDMRDSGIGSKVLELLKERFPDRRLILEIERLGTGVDEETEKLRIRRKDFYLRNGMRETGMLTKLGTEPMEILTNGAKIADYEYIDIHFYTLGRRRAVKYAPKVEKA